MSEKFYTILTAIGKAKIANSGVLGTKVNFVKLKVGDGNGNYYNPTEDQTDLINTVWEGNITHISVDEKNPNWINIEIMIPANVGGFMIREYGAFDDEGNMLAIAKCAESYKPIAEDGSTKELLIKMVLAVSNTQNISLKIDPTIIFAKKTEIEVLSNNLNDFKKSVESSLSEMATEQSNIKNNIGTETLLTTKKNLKGAINEVKQTVDNLDLSDTSIKITDKNNHFTANTLDGVLNEVFINVDNGKRQLGTALSTKGVTVPNNSSFDDLANSIKNIKTDMSLKIYEQGLQNTICYDGKYYIMKSNSIMDINNTVLTTLDTYHNVFNADKTIWGKSYNDNNCTLYDLKGVKLKAHLIDPSDHSTGIYLMGGNSEKILYCDIYEWQGTHLHVRMYTPSGTSLAYMRASRGIVNLNYTKDFTKYDFITTDYNSKHSCILNDNKFIEDDFSCNDINEYILKHYGRR